MKRAILLRHARAADARDDVLRELTAEGREQARAAGDRIAALGAAWRPTRALCSSALRASETLAAARDALGEALAVELNERLYLANAAQLLAVLQRAPGADACVLVIAHEPGLSDLVRQLATRGEPEARLRFARGMPPASFAALTLDVTRWEDAAPACAELAAFERPRASSG
jgi:phosphohistidine phosphatase